MTFLAFGAADVFHRHGIHLAGTQVLMEPLIDVIEFVAFVSGAGRKVNPGCPVAVDTPAHAEIGELPDLVHLLDRAMTGLALNFSHLDVLGVIEIDEIRQIVDLNPFDRFAGPRVLSFCRIVTGITK